MSNTAMQMMEMHSDSLQGMDLALVQECIEACSASEQACTMCAGTMMSTMSGAMMGGAMGGTPMGGAAMSGAESMAQADGMAMCLDMCLNCADMSNTMMRMMLRPTGMSQPTMMAMLQAMVVMCAACADACDVQAKSNPDCAMCAEVCRHSMLVCQRMMDSMLIK
jgi:hypothetical protein